MNFENIKQDIISFADDEADVIVEKNGSILFTRNGVDELVEVEENNDTGGYYVRYKGNKYSYRVFLTKELAKLDLLATKLIERRSIVDPYIIGNSQLITNRGIKNGSATEILEYECSDFLTSGTKLTFITADAGHGKTALLKEFQRSQSKRFLEGKSRYLFWHVDLQGRELVRLNEAIMYDLGDLRMPGLFYSSILTLLKRKCLVLAIDGFDELAAEIGGSVALGALSSLVSQMDNSGTIVAASRRTFFDTQDYIKRSRILERSVSTNCEFNEIKLENWDRKEVISYTDYYFDSPESVYQSLLVEFGNNTNHPVLTRPFLVTKVIEGMSETGMSAAEFIGNLSSPLEGVAAIVNAFIRREVTKWKQRDTNTGKPYLNFDQHLELLELVAYEMWISKSETISVEEIQLISTLLCEEWNIDTTVRPMVINMVKSHAFLIPASDVNPMLRKFEHEEFRNFFLSSFLANSILTLSNGGRVNDLRKFLYVSQMPDNVAQYAFTKIENEEINIPKVLDELSTMISNEWKPTYIQTNIGTIVPYLLDIYNGDEVISFSAKVNYTSLVFENRSIKNAHISNGNFINISLRNSMFNNFIFSDCHFNSIKIHVNSDNEFEQVNISKTCQIDSISIYRDGILIDSAYSPASILKVLHELKLRSFEEEDISFVEEVGRLNKVAVRFLNYYNRSTTQYSKNIEEDGFYAKDRSDILDSILPLLEKYQIVSEVESTKSRQFKSKAWRLNYALSEVLMANTNNDPSIEKNLRDFWNELNRID